MMLQSYKIVLNDLKATCSLSVYKNLSLLMRIENKQYSLIQQSTHFNGQATMRNRHIDNVVFQFDHDRHKYLPKKLQMQLQLKLVYRTGKINIKIYPINLNEFSIIKKGVKSKYLKIYERLYSLQCTILAKSDGTDSPFLSPTHTLSHVRSQRKLEKPTSHIRTSQYLSKSPQPLVKYVMFSVIYIQTINEKIKITNRKVPIYGRQHPSQISDRVQQKQTSILKESFQQNENHQKSHDSHRQRPKIFRKYQPSSLKRLSNFTEMPTPKASRQSNEQKENLINQIKFLQSQLDKQRSFASNYLKQISQLKNKVEHLYHEKSLLNKQKEQDREMFLTKDKQQKIRQRREIQILRRQFDKKINEKDLQIRRLQTSNDHRRSRRNSQMENQENETARKQFEDMQRILTVTRQQLEQFKFNFKTSQQTIKRLQQELYALRDQNGNLINKVHFFEKQNHENATKSLNNSFQKVTSQNNYQNSQNSQNENRQFLQLVEKQTQTYHDMISKLEINIKRLQQQLSKLQDQNELTYQQLQHKNDRIQELQAQIIQRDRRIAQLDNRGRVDSGKKIQIGHLNSGYIDNVRRPKVTFNYQPQHSIIYTPIKENINESNYYGTHYDQYGQSNVNNNNDIQQTNRKKVIYTTQYYPSTIKRNGLNSNHENRQQKTDIFFGDSANFSKISAQLGQSRSKKLSNIEKQMSQKMQEMSARMKKMKENMSSKNIDNSSKVQQNNFSQNSLFQRQNVDDNFENSTQNTRNRSHTVTSNLENHMRQNKSAQQNQKNRSRSQDNRQNIGKNQRLKRKKRFAEDVLIENFKVTEENQQYRQGPTTVRSKRF